MALFQENAYQYFKKEIEETGNKKIKKLEEEIESIKSKSLMALQTEIEDTITRAKDNELNELNLEQSTQINRVKVSVNKEIIKKKRDLLESVLLEVKQKLLKFVKTDEYKEKMILTIKKIDAHFCGKEIQFKIKKNDKVLRDLIKQNFMNKYEIIEDDSIIIGGFMAICLEKGIMTDQTIDSSLEERKKWFFQHSKLAVKK